MTDRRFTVLVVDDDADARILMRAALRKAGFEVQLAGGGEDALRQFRADPCDMVMLDVEMPDLGGHEVCAILRAEAGPLLPIVMVTGMDEVQSVETAYQNGATDFIAKPVNWALLGKMIPEILPPEAAEVCTGALHTALARGSSSVWTSRAAASGRCKH